jgi:cell division septal protein FtsQ
MPIAICTLLLLVAIGVAATWPGFDPKQITVTGNHRVGSDEILSRAAIAPHVTIWLQNTGAIARRIEAIPYIGSAVVARRLPAAMRITVVERAPFAILRSGYEAAVVDRSLRVLEPASDQQLAELVIRPGANLVPGGYVKTREAFELRSAYDAVASSRIVPVELSLDRFGGLIVTTRGGLKLLLGTENDLESKLTLADAILAQVVTRQRRVAAIDLRAPAAPVLVYGASR